jgi:hypothetical protein
MNWSDLMCWPSFAESSAFFFAIALTPARPKVS